MQTVRFKSELERNITIKLGYANAKVFRCSADGEWQLYSNQDDETFEELPPPHPHSVDLAGLKSGTRYEVSLALAVGEVTYYIIFHTY